MVDLIYQKMLDHVSGNSRLVITGTNTAPIWNDDLKTSHEEADVIIIQQMVKLAMEGIKDIQVVCAMFVLLGNYHIKDDLTCDVTMESPISNGP